MREKGNLDRKNETSMKDLKVYTVCGIHMAHAWGESRGGSKTKKYHHAKCLHFLGKSWIHAHMLEEDPKWSDGSSLHLHRGNSCTPVYCRSFYGSDSF